MASGAGREDVRLPALTDMHINLFSVGEVSNMGSYILNGIVGKYGNGEYFVQQRPSFQIFDKPADASVTDVIGRSIYYHATADNLYIVNDTRMYYDEYANLMTLATVATHSADTSDATWFTTGTQRIYPARLGNDVFFINPESNEGKYIRSATDYTVLYDMGNGAGEHTSDDFTAFPPNNSRNLAHGTAVLDQTLYVLATDGTIWGSALADGKDWSDALNVVTAEKEEDAGVFIAKHYDNVVVFGRRTIEFFYNIANDTGSPLGIRQDISYNVGCADPLSVWQHGDDIYFLGIDHSGQIQPYRLRQFQLEPINNAAMASFFTVSKSQDDLLVMGSGMAAAGEAYYILSTYFLNDDGDPEVTVSYVYNTKSQIWTEWQFSEATMQDFPLVQYTMTDDDRIGEGIMLNGQLVFAVDNFTPADGVTILGTDPYVSSGYVASDYVVESSGSSSYEAIKMVIRLDNWDGGNRNNKFLHQLRVVCDETANSQNMTVRWNDGESFGNAPDYTGTRTIDLQSNKNKLTRCGKFKSRSFEMEYQGSEQIRVKGLDMTLTGGTV